MGVKPAHCSQRSDRRVHDTVATDTLQSALEAPHIMRPQCWACTQVLAKVLEAEQRRLASALPAGDVVQDPGRSGLISAFRREKAAVLEAAAASFNELATTLQELSDSGGMQ